MFLLFLLCSYILQLPQTHTGRGFRAKKGLFLHVRTSSAGEIYGAWFGAKT